jgi:2-polyprenyl-3-methyl-5-hydroxy-6-metoxy-1,4-benzoquinol methylase
MIFFILDQDITLTIEGKQQQVYLACPNFNDKAVKTPIDRVYCTTFSEYQDLNQTFLAQKIHSHLLNEAQIRQMARFPVELGLSNINEPDRLHLQPEFKQQKVSLLEQIQLFRGKKVLHIALLNGVGGGLGDAIIGLTALRVLHKTLKQHFSDVKIDIFTRADRLYYTQAIYQQQNCVNEIKNMPLTLETFFAYDAFLDFSGFIDVYDQFKGMPMLDFYFHKMGIDGNEIKAEDKRNLIKCNQKIERHTAVFLAILQHQGRPLLLFHPKTSTHIRSIPDGQQARFLNFILAQTDYTVVCVLPIEFEHPRFINMTALSASFEHLCCIIKAMDAIITADTVVYHIADSFDIPTVVLFSTIDPVTRVSHYPHTRGLLLPDARDNPLFSKHKHEQLTIEETEGLLKLWENLDLNSVLDALNEVKTQSKSLKTCPVCASQVPSQKQDVWLDYQLFECNHCHAVFSQPHEQADDLIFNETPKHLPDLSQVAQAEQANTLIQGIIAQLHMQKIADIMRFMPNKGAHLDIGCNIGAFVAFCQNLGFSSYGVSNRAELVNAGKNFFPNSLLAVANRWQELPEAFPKQYQIISSFDVLAHITQPKQLAQQVFNHLKSGGYWFLSTPNANRLAFVAGIYNPHKHLGLEHGDLPPQNLIRWQQPTQKQFLIQQGFEIVEQYATPLVEQTVTSVLGDMPDLKLKLDDQEIKIGHETLQSISFTYLAPLFSLIDGYGNFIVTVARKP